MELSDVLKGAAIGAGALSVPLGFYIHSLKKQLSSKDEQLQEAYSDRKTLVAKVDQTGATRNVQGGVERKLKVKKQDTADKKISEWSGNSELNAYMWEVFEEAKRTGQKVTRSYVKSYIRDLTYHEIVAEPETKEGVATGDIKFLVRHKDGEFTRLIVAKFIDPAVVEDTEVHPQRYDPDFAEKKTVSVLYTDLRSFTSWVEKNKIEVIKPMLDDHLDSMVEIGRKYHGILDKKIGDSVMMIFNAPNDLENFASKAVQSSFEMHDYHRQWIAKNSALGHETRKMGIGIGTGEVIVGSFGRRANWDYTVLGDGVNTAARLNGIAEADEILIDKRTYDLLTDELKLKFHSKGKMKVKGKDLEVETYSHVWKY